MTLMKYAYGQLLHLLGTECSFLFIFLALKITDILAQEVVAMTAFLSASIVGTPPKTSAHSVAVRAYFHLFPKRRKCF